MDPLFTFFSFTHRYDNGINTFDTANVYSNGESERILGKALKEHKIPRENVVIMTKVCLPLRQHGFAVCSRETTQVFFIVREDDGPPMMARPDENGFVNRHGLSRKVNRSLR